MWLLTAATVAGSSSIHYQTPMLGAMAHEFGASASQVGWVPTLTFGGFLAGIVLSVPLGDRVDKRRLILVQYFANIVALLAAAAAPGIGWLAAIGFLIGACASYSQSIVPLAAELAPDNARGRAVATILTAIFVGILLGRIAGGVVATHLGWRWMYGLAALLAVALSPWMLSRLPSSTAHTSLSYGRLLTSMLGLIGRHAEMRRVVAIQLLLGVCYGGFWATIATMLLSVHHLGPTAAGLIGIPGAAGILIARPAGRWLDRRGPGPIVTAGAALIIAAYGVFALGTWWPAALAVGAALLDCGLRATMVSNQTVANLLAPEARSRSNTVFGLSVWSGNAIGAFVASTAFAAKGWLAVCAISAASATCALLVQLLASRRRGG